MYGCIQGSIFTVTAELYHQVIDQNPSSGEIERKWVFLKKIPCSILPIRETGASSTSDNKYFGKEYIEELETKMHTSEQLSKRWRVSNISNLNKKSIYKEIDRIAEPDTIFEIYGSHPVLDIFGNIQYYENHLRRVQVQSND